MASRWIRPLSAAALLTLTSLWPAHAQFGPQEPDLVVTEITLSNERPAPGDELTVRATIKNAGEAEADGGFNVRFHLSLAPDQVAITFGAPINDLTVSIQRQGRGLRPGEERTVSFPWTVVGVPLLRLRATVDAPLDRVQEADERNNTLERAVFIEEAELDAWWQDQIGGREALALERGSEDVVVAVVDSGIDWSHPELADRLWTNPGEAPGNGQDDDGNGFVDDVHGWDFVDDDNNLGGTPRDLHATAVAGIVAAADDGRGTTGVAPGARLMDLRVLDSRGFGGFDDVTAAIHYAVAHGADVINLSLGAPENAAEFCPPTTRAICSDQLDALLAAQEAAIDAARAAGAVVVASAGNEGAGVGFPARFESALAVGATTLQNRVAGYSNRGGEVVVTAPGGDLSEEQLRALFASLADDFQAVVPQLASLIVAPYPGEGYGWFSGTSAAAPFVSGVVALMRSANPDLTPDQITQILRETATDRGASGRDDSFGAGIVHARRAVEAARTVGN